MPANLLPKKLSDCILVALDDLTAAKKAGMVVDMSQWYTKTSLGTCTVCLAGAVLAREFDLDEGECLFVPELSRQVVSRHDSKALLALNFVRSGNIAQALQTFYPDHPVNDLIGDDAYFRSHDGGHKDTPQWRRDMKKIAKTLKSLSL